MGNPGALCPPDSLLNGTSSILVSSPLCHPRFKLVETAEDFRVLASLYFCDSQSLDITFDDSSSGDTLLLIFIYFANCMWYIRMCVCMCSGKSFSMHIFY